jgi:hypothetical protein
VEQIRSRDMVITGIPRSGTSYLCSLLHRFEDCVVLNEPGEVLLILRSNPTAEGIRQWYDSTRIKILEHRPILNKVKDGRLVQDTIECHEASLYSPRPATRDFALGTKNTLAYLARLPALKAAMHSATFVAAVRSPFETIASWKRSFPHLRDSTGVGYPVGSLHDEALDHDQRRDLERIAHIADAATRRAEFWNYLAGLILAHAEQTVLLRYSDLVLAPAEALEPIVQRIGLGALREPFRPSALSQDHLSLLDANDRAAIQCVCSDRAEALGVM